MTDGDELARVIATIYERNRELPSISPAWLATAGMQTIRFPRTLHALGYVGCHLQLRQIARKYCRKAFDPVDGADGEGQEEMFPETLQERYPLRPKRGEEPQYVMLEFLSDQDVDYNIARMRRASLALQKHSDALEAWKRERPKVSYSPAAE